MAQIHAPESESESVLAHVTAMTLPRGIKTDMKQIKRADLLKEGSLVLERQETRMKVLEIESWFYSSLHFTMEFTHKIFLEVGWIVTKTQFSSVL